MSVGDELAGLAMDKEYLPPDTWVEATGVLAINAVTSTPSAKAAPIIVAVPPYTAVTAPGVAAGVEAVAGVGVAVAGVVAPGVAVGAAVGLTAAGTVVGVTVAGTTGAAVGIKGAMVGTAGAAVGVTGAAVGVAGATVGVTGGMVGGTSVVTVRCSSAPPSAVQTAVSLAVASPILKMIVLPAKDSPGGCAMAKA